MCVLVKMVTLRPALYFVKSLPTFKALTVIADIMQSSALRMQSYALSVMHRMFFFKISSQFVLSDHMRRLFHRLKKRPSF